MLVDEKKYSQECRDFVAACLSKNPSERPTYTQMMKFAWIERFERRDVDMAAWVVDAVQYRTKGKSPSLKPPPRDSPWIGQ
jgi:mitogen-activated protein kinase kinase